MDAKAAARKTAATREGIKTALLRLMEKKPYHDISVPDIVLEASTARCTFYRHFPTKDEVLLACCKDRFEGLYRRMQEEPSYTFHDTSLGYYMYWQEHLPFLQLLQKQDLLFFFTKNLDRFLYDVTGRAGDEDEASAPPAKLVYHFFCSMSAMSGILLYWLNTGCRESAEQLAQYYVSFLAEGSEGDDDCRYFREHHEYPFKHTYV
ncbi:MAG: TetR/AcrR family transcriptional regulator [Lachnospiraceae bacterium]|nr:TetR/AcrR family transcriptional regulator [Lachnospiraceae bacterium]